METLLAHSLDHDDERMEFADECLDTVRFGDRHVGRLTLEPGWRWSRSVASWPGRTRARPPHLGYVVSGRLHVRMADGSQGEAGPGAA
jgi:hypothetical protein